LNRGIAFCLALAICIAVAFILMTPLLLGECLGVEASRAICMEEKRLDLLIYIGLFVVFLLAAIYEHRRDGRLVFLFLVLLSLAPMAGVFVFNR
jgi:formate hydrogenlyase subunit 3/multisubunit Na+/H+ antiporter MnhD subunit